MNAICDAVIQCHATWYVTSSYQEPNAPLWGTISDPVRFSSHGVSHAIDMNIVYRENQVLYYSQCLGRYSISTEVKCFIAKIQIDDFQ